MTNLTETPEMIQKGSLKCEGKTKKIWNVDQPGMVILEAKNAITANNDPSYTRQLAKKDEYSTNTTCRVFELLKKAGIPVAYEKQLSKTEFLAKDCEMILLEVVARRYAFGSYLKRMPEFKRDSKIPYQFSTRVLIEFFLKTTGGELILQDGRKVVEGLSTEEDDPFIGNSREFMWKLYHPKKPKEDPTSALGQEIGCLNILRNTKDISRIELITRRVFLTLEKAFQKNKMILVDFKIEFGYTSTGELVVSDVIDCDSWRLWNEKYEDYSKQSFRDGESLDEVEKKYGYVSNLVNQF